MTPALVRFLELAHIARITLIVIAALFAFSAMAVEPEPQRTPRPTQELDFSPPPVPEFMLRRPQKPLTLEEMKKQAEEASRRARAEKERRAPPTDQPAKEGIENAK